MYVMQSKLDHNRFRIRTNACKDRFCEACAVERRRLIARNLIRHLPPNRLVFVTLTLRSNANPLASQLDRLIKSFHKLRNRSSMKKHFTGGLYFTEITRNPHTGLWHPHIHIILDTSYIPQKPLSSVWHAITGDSFIVDVREIRNPHMIAGYITKYAAKAIGSSVWTHPPSLQEAIEALSGRRTFSTFGNWKEMDLSKKPDDDEGWFVIAALATLIRHARLGDHIAQDILNHVRYRPDHDPEYTDTT
jgi:hypothetical protein